MKKLFYIATFGVIATSCVNEHPKEAGDSRILYEKNCQSCHGDDGALGIGGAKDLSSSILTDEEKKKIIKYGQGKMQAFDYLSDEDIDAIVKHVNTLKK